MAKLDKAYVTSIAAPTLLELIRDTGKFSYLRQKMSNKIRREEKWKYCFAVLVNTAVYIYDDETSSKPRHCVNLVGYDCVKRVESDKCLFGFAISCTKKSKSEEQFASFSDFERRQWMRKIKEHLHKSNNIPFQEFMFESSIEDESEYRAMEEPIKLKDDSTSSNGFSDGIFKKSSRRNAVTDVNYLDDR